MRDDFFEEKKRRGVGITFIIVVILVVAMISSMATYFFMPKTYTIKKEDNQPLQNTTTVVTEKVVVDGGMEDVFTALYENNRDTVVVIDGYVIQNDEEVHYSQSSGFIVSEDGYIFTNHHCVADMDKITVSLYDGKEYAATVIGSDDRTEVAVIKIEDEMPFKKAILGDSDKTKVGQYAVAIGNPIGFEYSMSIGFVSGLEREVDSQNFRYKMIQIDTPLNSGNSGGPLFNSDGEVIGINTMKSSSYVSNIEGIGFAIPINIAKNIADELIKNGKVTRPAIEATVGSYIGEGGGALVAEVIEGGAAEKAGIKANDIIISFNGAEIQTVNDLISELENCKAGEEKEIIVIRDNEELKLKIILGTTK